MFDNNKNTIIKNLEKEVKDNALINIRLREDHERETAHLKAVNESNNKIKNAELATKIAEAITAEKALRETIEKENAVLKKEVEILTKAFENMGFDVKDMKSILDKLVDGIISKNQINVVK